MDRGDPRKCAGALQFRLCGPAGGDGAARERGVPDREEAGVGRGVAQGDELSRGGPFHPQGVPQGLGSVGLNETDGLFRSHFGSDYDAGLPVICPSHLPVH